MENKIELAMYTFYAWLLALFEFLWLRMFEMVALTCLMAIDVITWVAKQYRIKPQGITSNRLIVWIVSKMLILLCVFCVALAIKWIWLDFLTEDYLTVAMVALIWWETYSILANVYAFNTKTELPEFDVISKFISWTAQTFKDFLEKIIPHKDNK